MRGVGDERQVHRLPPPAPLGTHTPAHIGMLILVKPHERHTHAHTHTRTDALPKGGEIETERKRERGVQHCV